MWSPLSQFLSIREFYLHVCLCAMCMPVPLEGRRGHWTPRNGVLDLCELPHGCWDPTPGLLEKQSVFLTTDPSLQLLPPSPFMVRGRCALFFESGSQACYGNLKLTWSSCLHPSAKITGVSHTCWGSPREASLFWRNWRSCGSEGREEVLVGDRKEGRLWTGCSPWEKNKKKREKSLKSVQCVK